MGDGGAPLLRNGGMKMKVLVYGAVMLVGIGELISERMQKRDRVLPKKRLYRSFGALAFGGLAVSGIQENIRRSLKRAARRKGAIWTLHAI